MTTPAAPAPETAAPAAAASETAAGAMSAVRFVAPMPGLAPHTAFTLAQIGESSGLYTLRAADADVRLFLLDPRTGAYGYAPSVPADSRAMIGAADDAEVALFVVANPSAEGVRVNFKAPILIHLDTGLATQIILDDPAYPVRALLAS